MTVVHQGIHYHDIMKRQRAAIFDARKASSSQLSDGRGSVTRLRKLRDQWRQQRYLLVSFHFIYPGSRVVWGCLPRSRIYITQPQEDPWERRKKIIYWERRPGVTSLTAGHQQLLLIYIYSVLYTLYGISSVYLLLYFLSLKEYWRLRRVSHELSRLRWLPCIRQV